MTATIVPLFSQPIDTARAVQDARTVLFSPLKVEDRDLRTACHVLLSMGDADDYMMAQVALLMLDRGDLRQEPDDSRAVVVYLLAAVAGTLSIALALVLL